MTAAKNKFYLYLFLTCLVGYSWLFLNCFLATERQGISLGVCIFKHTTSIPCPSCGSTRSVLSLLNGNFSEAVLLNPFGIVLFIGLIITSFWLVYDRLSHRESLFAFYTKMEIWFKLKIVYIPAIILIAGNWIWNIVKGL